MHFEVREHEELHPNAILMFVVLLVYVDVVAIYCMLNAS